MYTGNDHRRHQLQALISFYTTKASSWTYLTDILEGEKLCWRHYSNPQPSDRVLHLSHTFLTGLGPFWLARLAQLVASSLEDLARADYFSHQQSNPEPGVAVLLLD